MSTFNFQPDDPRLTAYALGELNPSERAEIEAMLAESSEARTALEEIRETIGLLSRELTFEPALTLTMTQRQAVEQAVGVEVPASETRATVVAPTSVKTARWGAIARAATTVAAVTVAAGGFLYVSRVFEHDESSFAKNESTPVGAKQASLPESHLQIHLDASDLIVGSKSSQMPAQPGTVEISSRPVITTIDNLIGGTAGDRVSAPKNDDSTPRTSEAPVAVSEPALIVGTVKGSTIQSKSDEGISIITDNSESAAGTPGESLTQITMPEPRRRAGSWPNDAELAESLLAQSSSPTSVSSSGIDGKNVAVGGSGVPVQSDAKTVNPESKRTAESEVLRESELRKSVAAAESSPAGVEANFSGSTTATIITGSLEAEARGGFGGGGLGAGRFEGQVDSLELRRREESEELLKQQSSQFRTLSAAASGTEAYEPIVENEFLTPMEQPLSTFSIDVDTASYANMRRFIQQGQLPPANAVRIEELVNYFRYDYPEPADGRPFSVNIDVATCPWNPQNKLARVGLKAKTIAEDKRPATNLVFLIDVSGSMAAENKLPLVKQALNVLVSKMGEDDQIAIVTYAGEAGLKLNSTSGSQRTVIQQAIDSLQSGGSTNGAAGINIAYDTAIQSFIKGGANRVILCTDGDFNVGVSDDNTLVEMIQEKAASGVFLSVFGFGMGNLKDAKLEKLADKGNGNYGYIDGLGEARKVFGEQLSGTLVTVAKDVKLQLEFNNSTVGAYRLIGYENRVLAAKDFDDDTKDAGEIGAGHTVTALYEIVPKAAWLTQAGLDPEKFDIVEKPTANDETKEVADGRLFTVKLRHKLPDAETSEKSQDYAAMNSDAQLSDSNVDFRFAAAVASFGMQLRESKFRGNWTLQNVLSMADASLSTDRNGERTEFTDLVRGVMRLKGDSITDPRLTTHETVAPVTPTAELPTELSTNDARIKATVDGKYRRLLKKIEVRSDFATYGEFRDFGHWDGTDYSGHSDLPAGYWVWVYPNWYIWGDVEEPKTETQP